MPRIAQYLKYSSKMTKLKVNIIRLLLGDYGYLIIWPLPMASYIYMQKLNEISQVIFSILHGERKKNKLNISFFIRVSLRSP